jgi:hypothetical protein
MNTIIQTPTNGLSNSLEYYTTLEFEVISEASPTIVTDGKVAIEINPDRYARAGVKLYASSWQSIIPELEKHTAVIKTDAGYLLSDPSGVWLYLNEGESPYSALPAEKSSSVLGNCAGLSLETTDIERSLAIWKIAGFDNITGAIEQGWVAATNAEGHGVSLMKPNACPHLFFNPSLTYFNGAKNLDIIAKIRALNIPIAEEITHFNKEGIADNIIIRDPGGLGFFLFSD